MGYREDMEKCRAYIDEHLTEDVTPQALAGLFSYSYCHFCHVFRAVNGMAVGAYLRDRRLCRAASELLDGKSVTTAAMDCGFDTHSGFTRAFCRRFGMNPTEYRKAKGGRFKMTPEIKRLEAFTAVGYALAPPEGDMDILDNGAYWLGKDFRAVSKEDYAKLTYPGYAEIGAWMHPSDETGEFYYFLGPMTKDKRFIPDGMVALDVPAAEYAVFAVPKADSEVGLNENVKKTWKFIFNDWLDGSGYKFDHTAMDFEYYLGEDTFIYVPVVKK